jgi:hypothetical protein
VTRFSLLLPDSGECRQAAVRFAAAKLSSRVILRRAELDRSDVLRAPELMQRLAARIGAAIALKISAHVGCAPLSLEFHAALWFGRQLKNCGLLIPHSATPGARFGHREIPGRRDEWQLFLC